jgi:hypothetical protein
MGNWKSRSDDQIWWESQPGNRGRTYPGDDIASKQYERNKAAGENNLSIAKSFWNRLTKPSHVDLGPPDQDISAYPKNDRGGVSSDEAKGGKIDLKNCKVSTHEKNSKHKHSW